MNSGYDYVIVGSGIAATLVCDRLLEADPLNSKSILVLEAGERIPSRDRRSWWDLVLDGRTPYEGTYDDDVSRNKESFSTGKTHWAFRESRVRAYGGSTMHWGGWALRFKEEDFKCQTNTQKGADWPFEYEELEPWYALAEQKLGVGGDAKDEGPKRSGNYPLPPYVWTAHEAELAEALEDFDLKPGHMPIARHKRCMTTGTCKYCPIGARFSAQDHMDTLKHEYADRIFDLTTNATVRRIMTEGNRAHAVKYLDTTTGKSITVEAGKVIVCAGTYESTKLLLASTPKGLGNESGHLGRHIVTHLLFSVKGTREKNRKRLFQEYDFPTLMSRSWDTPERQAEGKMFVFNNRSLPNTDFAKLMIECQDREDIDKAAEGPSEAGLSAFIEEFGHFDNQLELRSGFGKFGLPKTGISFSRHEEDAFNKTVKRAQQVLSQILESRGYECAESRLEDPRGDHASGTCRMGSDSGSSVTTGDLAVHGVDDLFVCSNAVLPNAAAVNPTLTLSALALRLGARLGNGELG